MSKEWEASLRETHLDEAHYAVRRQTGPTSQTEIAHHLLQ